MVNHFLRRWQIISKSVAILTVGLMGVAAAQEVFKPAVPTVASKQGQMNPYLRVPDKAETPAPPPSLFWMEVHGTVPVKAPKKRQPPPPASSMVAEADIKRGSEVSSIRIWITNSGTRGYYFNSGIRGYSAITALPVLHFYSDSQIIEVKPPMIRQQFGPQISRPDTFEVKAGERRLYYTFLCQVFMSPGNSWMALFLWEKSHQYQSSV